MLPLVSLLTQFLLLTLAVTAAVLGIAVGYFYVLSRRTAQRGGLSERERAELRQRDVEIAAIRTRIEEIYQRQQSGPQTQSQVVLQHLEQVQHQLKARARQIEGLQGQLRAEMDRREKEMAELRARLDEAVATRAIPAAPTETPRPALPPASQAPAPPEAPAVPPAVDTPPEPEPEPEPGWSWEPIQLNFTLEEDEPSGTFPGDGAASTAHFPALTGAGEPRGASLPHEEAPVEDAVGGDAPAETFPIFEIPSFTQVPAPGSTPAPEATAQHGPSEAADEEDDLDGLVQWTLLDLPDVHPEPASEGPSPAYGAGDGMAAEAVPPGAEDLTVVAAVDAARQAVLYRLGVRTLAEMARWSRADARRIAEAMPGVGEDEIMNSWVFDAQSILFDRYQQELTSRRTGV